MFRTLTIQRSALVVVLAGAVVATSEAQTDPAAGLRPHRLLQRGIATLTGSVRGSTSRWTMTARNPASSS